jgi:hypothetical protein
MECIGALETLLRVFGDRHQDNIVQIATISMGATGAFCKCAAMIE